jgi:hypothetical protein
MAQAQAAKRSKSGDDRSQKRGRGQASRAGASGTPERDEVYGLVSVLYHALQGSETYEQYIRDAESAGDEELSSFFENCQEEESQRAIRARELLTTRLGGELDVEDDAEDEDEEDDDE